MVYSFLQNHRQSPLVAPAGRRPSDNHNNRRDGHTIGDCDMLHRNLVDLSSEASPGQM